MIFYRHADGSVTVDSFAEEDSITIELLSMVDPRHIEVDWSGLLISILGQPYRITSVEWGVANIRRMDG